MVKIIIVLPIFVAILALVLTSPLSAYALQWSYHGLAGRSKNHKLEFDINNIYKYKFYINTKNRS